MGAPPVLKVCGLLTDCIQASCHGCCGCCRHCQQNVLVAKHGTFHNIWVLGVKLIPVIRLHRYHRSKPSMQCQLHNRKRTVGKNIVQLPVTLLELNSLCLNHVVCYTRCVPGKVFGKAGDRFTWPQVRMNRAASLLGYKLHKKGKILFCKENRVASLTVEIDVCHFPLVLR